MLTPEQYDAFQKGVKKFENYIQNHPEVIEEEARKWAEQFVDYKDIVLGDKILFKREGEI